MLSDKYLVTLIPPAIYSLSVYLVQKQPVSIGRCKLIRVYDRSFIVRLTRVSHHSYVAVNDYIFPLYINNDDYNGKYDIETNAKISHVYRIGTDEN